ncbi:hypothetical protein ACFX2G_040870 [Malus domestica]
MLSLARVFTTAPLSHCLLPLLAALLGSCHGFLPLCGCARTVVCGCWMRSERRLSVGGAKARFSRWFTVAEAVEAED